MGGMGMMGAGDNAFMLLRRDDVRKELELLDDQVEELERLSRSNRKK